MLNYIVIQKMSGMTVFSDMYEQIENIVKEMPAIAISDEDYEVL